MGPRRAAAATAATALQGPPPQADSEPTLNRLRAEQPEVNYAAETQGSLAAYSESDPESPGSLVFDSSYSPQSCYLRVRGRCYSHGSVILESSFARICEMPQQS